MDCLFGVVQRKSTSIVYNESRICLQESYVITFDYIHSRGIDLVRSLKLQAIRERRDYFLCVLRFKCIHGLAPHYLSNDVIMHVDIHGYDTRSAENMDLYIPRCTKEIHKSFSCKGSSLWNKLPTWVKESTSLNNCKHNYRLSNGWIHPKVPLTCTPISFIFINFVYS